MHLVQDPMAPEAADPEFPAASKGAHTCTVLCPHNFVKIEVENLWAPMQQMGSGGPQTTEKHKCRLVRSVSIQYSMNIQYIMYICHPFLLFRPSLEHSISYGASFQFQSKYPLNGQN